MLLSAPPLYLLWAYGDRPGTVTVEGGVRVVTFDMHTECGSAALLAVHSADGADGPTQMVAEDLGWLPAPLTATVAAVVIATIAWWAVWGSRRQQRAPTATKTSAASAAASDPSARARRRSKT
jgi:hypothetical protein